MKTVAIIGGGPAGMMAAIFAAKQGNRVVLLEKNEKLGKKLYITGKGRCNLTNDCDEEEFLNNVVSNPRFLYGAVNRFPPEKTIDFFEENGLRLKTERGNRIFPASDKASDVTKTLANVLKNENAEICCNEKVLDIEVKDGKVVEVITESGHIACDAVILATGGKSYVSTGSDGFGYEIAARLGHTVVLPRPALVGLELNGDFYKNLQGLSLKNVKLTAICDKKTVFCELGEMLFTHYGISGPLTLTLSSLINRYDLTRVSLFLDLKPGLDEEKLKARLQRDFNELKGKNLYNSLVKLMPSRLIGEVLIKAGLPQNKNPFSLTKTETEALIKAIKAFDMKISRLRPLDEAIITAGGIKVSEINPKTMESKLVKSLYFAGEIIDVDALTGGFNIQIAFSTGYLAGTNA